MKENRILIIGGVAAGAKAAARARRRDPTAEITIVERGRFLSYTGYGMPYFIGPYAAIFWRIVRPSIRPPQPTGEPRMSDYALSLSCRLLIYGLSIALSSLLGGLPEQK